MASPPPNQDSNMSTTSTTTITNQETPVMALSLQFPSPIDLDDPSSGPSTGRRPGGVPPLPPPPSSSESSSSSSEDDQESDHEAFELPPVPPQKTCGSGLPKAQVGQADYPVSKILKRGYAYNSKLKRRVIGNLVEHEPLIYFDEELDCPDLEPESYGPIATGKKGHRWAHLAPAELAAEEEKMKKRKKWGIDPKTPCRFCGKTFARKDGADVHERDTCTEPGAPNHVCGSDPEKPCPTPCIGPRVWVRSAGKPRGRKAKNP
uniref:Uncharacterized protein n=1 Tax=Tetranychus urticae TaxID=32264 RepID=T1KXF3_TETUR